MNKSYKIKKDTRDGWLMAIWPVVGFAIFGFIPLLLSLIISFTSLKSYRIEEATFFSFTKLFSNYVSVFRDHRFYKAITNTLFYCLSLPISAVLGLLIASLLNKKLKGAKFYRTIFFIPYVCSVVAISTMWKWMFNYQFGLMNNFLSWFHIAPIDWLGDATSFRFAILIIIVWSSTGFNIILFQSALANVSKDLYESAEIDGANKWEKFVHVTLPIISPTTFYILVTGLIGSLQAFTQMQTMVDSGSFGPGEAGLTIVFYLYYMAIDGITSYGFGLASAVAWILAIAIILITIFNFKMSKKWVHYN